MKVKTAHQEDWMSCQNYHLTHCRISKFEGL